jgi:hypothetical protein
MSVICFHVCRADPIGGWKEPPAMIFIDGRQSTDGSQYRCRDHLSPAKEEKLRAREKELSLPPGGLR